MEDSNKSIFIQNITNNDEIDSELLKLHIENPIKLNDIYYSELNFMFQSSKLLINSINRKTNKISLILDNDLESLLENFDKKIMELLVNNSSKLFEEEILEEEIEDIYNKSYNINKINSNIKANFNKKLVIYNKNKNLLELSDLEINDQVICLFKCSKIIYYKNYCKPYWEILQIKLKKSFKENLNNKIDKKMYLIRDDDNDIYKSDNEENNFLVKELNFKIN